MRVRSLVLAPLALLAGLVPAGSATASSTASKTCPSPLTYYDGRGIDSGTETTIGTGFDTPVPVRDYTFSLVRTAPAPAAVVQAVQAASGTVFTLRLEETHDFAVQVSAPDCATHRSGSFTVPVHPRTGTTISGECPLVLGARQTVTSGDVAEVRVENQSATATVGLRRTSPAPVAVVREGRGSAVFRVRPGESTRLDLFAESARRGTVCADLPIAIDVRPRLTLAAVRNAARDYTFSGRVLPGRGQDVALYRVEPSGARVLTARTRVGNDGTYRVDRRFTGSGRFGFEVRVGDSPTNLAGASAVRPTVVH